MVTDAELIFWIVCAVLAILFALSLPFIHRYIENKDTERMFYRPDTNIDDMEDRRA